MSRQLDVLLINHYNQQAVYQDLADKWTSIEPPTWSLLLAGACRNKGFGVAILDADAERLTVEECVERIRYLNPRLALFVTYGQNPNSGTTNMTGQVTLANQLRETYPEYKIAFIGSHASALPNDVLAYKFVDFVFYNEGVKPLINLLSTDLETDLDKIAGIGYKKDGFSHLTNGANTLVRETEFSEWLPEYAWDLLPYKNKPLDLYRSHVWSANYLEENRSPYVSLYSSLGCSFKCLAGDTPINTIYGKIAIKDLAEKYGSIPVFTYDREKQEVVVANGVKIRKTSTNKQLVRVHFDDGTHIDCTPDHRFLTFVNGNQSVPVREYEIEARNLKPNTRVRALKVTKDIGGYVRVSGNRRNNRPEHCLVMEYMLGRKMVNQEQVHHMDGIKTNNHPSNLVYCRDTKDHFQFHPEISERMKENNPQKYCTEESFRKTSIKTKGLKRSLETRIKLSESKKGSKNPQWKGGGPWNKYHKSRVDDEVNHKIVEVEYLDGLHDTYCMEVPGYSWFYANNVLVHNCEYCMVNVVNREDPSDGIHAANSNKMRYFPTSMILNEIDKLADLGVKNIRWADELLIYKQSHFIPLFTEIKNKYGDRFYQWVYSRINTMKEEYLELLRGAGIRWVAYGIESANQKIRQEITKGLFKDIDIREIVKLTEQYGVEVIQNFIVGLPTDDEATIQESLELALELNCAAMNVYPCFALPGSPLYYEAKQKGLKLPEKYSEWSFLSYDSQPLPTEKLEAKEVLRLRDSFWKSYYTNPNYLAMIEGKFGATARQNIEEMAQIKLRRKLLGTPHV